MQRKSRCLFHGLLFTVLALTTLVVLFYAEENWRGARAWAAVKRELQSRGEFLDFQRLVPPPVPDDQNLAMAPLFTRLFQYEVDPRTHLLTFSRGDGWYHSATYKLLDDMPLGREKYGMVRPVSSNWISGHTLDLGAFQRWYRQRPEFPKAAQPQSPADDVLMALTRYAPILDELTRASAERPKTRFPVNYALRPAWNITLPHYDTLQGLTTTLRLRAVAELRAGQTPAARRDIEQAFRLREGIEHDPALISGLVDITSIGLLIQPIWEGLEARRWTGDDLDALSGDLRSINVLREFQQSIRAERAIMPARWPEELQEMIQARELAKAVPRMTGEENGKPALPLEPLLWTTLPYWPRGWYAQNAALASRYFQEDWIDAVDPVHHRVDVVKSKEAAHTLKSTPLTPETLLMKISMSVLTDIARQFAQAQTVVDQAIIACALEKYFLDHQAYPVTLSALVPGYLERLPTDVIDGAAMRYRLTVDGRYQLYSVGWDGKDDGGAIAWSPDRKWRRATGGSPASQEQKMPNPVRDQGDWVWQYAPAEPPDPPANQSRLESLAPAGIIQG